MDIAFQNKLRLLDALRSLSLGDPTTAGAQLSSLRNAFLLFGSYSEDNCSAVDTLDYVAKSGEYSISYGLGVTPSGIRISDIIYQMESYPFPSELKTKFPSLTEEEWAAAMRIVVLILSALESLTVKEAGND